MAITKVTNSLVATNAIQGTLIADNAITSVHIAQNQVTAVQIPDGSITATQLGANSVDSSELVDGSIDTSHIADAQITTAKLGTNQVTSAKIAQNSVEARHIADGSITDTQLGSGAFTMGTITTTGAIRGPASLTIDPATVGDNTGTVVIAGNLQVDGTTTTVNSTTLDVADKNITLGKGGTASANNGGGITIDGAAATLLYQHSDTSWQMNKPLGVTGNAAFTGGITATYANLSSAVNALYFRTAAANTDYNLITRNNTGNALFIQSAQSNTNQPIANFRYGSATVNQGTPVLQVSKDNSHFVNCNVGIGTASPAVLLSVAGALGVGEAGSTGNRLQITTSSAGAIIKQADNSPIIFQTASGTLEKMRIQDSGNVGIGANSPYTLLELSSTDPIIRMTDSNGVTDKSIYEMRAIGASGYESLEFRSVNDANNAYNKLLVLKHGGNAGIGTDSPAYPLEVAGTTSTSIAYQRTGVSAKKWGFHTDNDNTYWQNITDNVLALTIKNNGNVGIGTTSPTTAKLDVAGTALVENAKLKAIAASNSDTARDVFVYDTRKDSDGGAWRKRTQNTSWYNEASGTNRSSRKEFPCVAVIVLESNETTIYDGDDPDMPMWMRFTNPGGGSSYMIGENSNKCVTMLNGVLGVGSNPHDFYVVNFIKDKGYQYSNNVLISGTYKGNISTRNVSTVGWIFGTVPNIIHRTINDVAMTVLPNAPIDADTGLPIPTIAVSTGGGVSVIKDNGTVVDITSANGWNPSGFLTFDKDNYIVAQVGNATGQGLIFRYPVPSSDTTVAGSDDSMLGGGNIYNQNFPHFGSDLGGLNTIAEDESGIAVNSKNNSYNQLVKYWKNDTDYSDSSVAYINSDYNTGWMVGDIKLATLSDTEAADNTEYVGGYGDFH